MRKINKVVVHCSDSDHAHHDNIDAIYQWHVIERGWSDIGYHYVITKDGVIHKGRPEEKAGAHVKEHNSDSIGICLTGSKVFSTKQLASLRMLVNADILPHHKLTHKDIYGHRDFDGSKTCPNFDVHQAIAWRD